MKLFSKIFRKLFFKKEKCKIPEQYADAEWGNLLFGNSRGKYAILREEFEDVFVDWLLSNEFNNYGYYKDQKFYNGSDHSTYKNSIFAIRPYYWGDDENIAVLPNFEYYPTDLQIKWYKYPLRDAYSNRHFTKEELIEILQNCKESME